MFSFQVAGKPAQAIAAFSKEIEAARKTWSGAQAEEKQLESILAAVRDEVNQHSHALSITATLEQGKDKARIFTVCVKTIEGWSD